MKKHKFVDLPLDDKEVDMLLELIAEEIDVKVEKEFDKDRERLQVVYDRLLYLAGIEE